MKYTTKKIINECVSISDLWLKKIYGPQYAEAFDKDNFFSGML